MERWISRGVKDTVRVLVSPPARGHEVDIKTLRSEFSEHGLIRHHDRRVAHDEQTLSSVGFHTSRLPFRCTPLAPWALRDFAGG